MKAIKKLVFSFVDGFISIGKLNADFYLKNGVSDSVIHFSPFSVDNGFFSKSDEDYRVSRECVRSNFDIGSDQFVVLVSSKFIKLKRIADVVQACALISKEYINLKLLLVGSGPEYEEILKLAKGFSHLNAIFAGFRNQSELPGIYSAADVFVLSSENEAWGLALNEAMAAGLPVVASDQVGAVPDLVEGKGTGIVYKCGDINELKAAIEKMMIDAKFRTECAKRSRELISNWDAKVCANGFVKIALDAFFHNKK